MTADRKADAQLALLCAAAEEAGAVKVMPQPPPGYTLHGYLTAIDAVFHFGPLQLGAERVFYGWDLSTPDGRVIVCRGTSAAIEWWIDAQFFPRTHAMSGGFVEEGFASIYDTLELQDLTGHSLGPAAGALAESCKVVTIAGHSLGGAWGTYLAADAAALGCHVTARFFASPRPGDAEYGKWAALTIDDLASYRFEPDVVPNVPAALGYSLLPDTIILPDDPHVRRSIACFHHAAVYASQLDPAIQIAGACLASP
jgi:hypothetical protein